MPTIQLMPENPSIDRSEEITVQNTHTGDSVLGVARVIAQVNTNANQFRGWGPKISS